MKAIKEFNGFELVGYHVDYYQDGKYIGCVKLDTPDREELGYHSRQYHIAENDFQVKRGKITTKIKKGSNYYTELQVICGKRIEDC